jgi:NAD(P)-dependent dehydrogenase (short-subunit alcohol dehydrogenase family)
VTICPAGSFLPGPLAIGYSAAKAVRASFSKAPSKEFGPGGIGGTTVSPGPAGADLWLGNGGVAATARACGRDSGAVAMQAASEPVTGRFTRPREIADLVVPLASDRAGNVTRAGSVIDGGLTTALRRPPGQRP